MLADASKVAPSDWIIQSIESVCSRVTSGGTPSRRLPEYFERGKWGWVKTQELLDGWIDDTEEHITDEAIANSSAKILPSNTVLIAMYGATVGQLGILRHPMTCNQACCAFIVDETKADFRYLFYQLFHHRSQLKSVAVGAAQQNLNAQILKQFELPFPPLPEQRAIAGVLGALDDKIELNRRMNRTLEAMARAVFRHWFVENEEAAGWKIGRLSEICTTQYGFTASASDKPVGPKFLRITDMNKEPWIDWASVPYCEIGNDELAKYKLELGDVLVSRIADPGKAGIVDEVVNAVFASYLVRLKFKDLAWSYFAYYFLRSDQYLEYAEGAKSGSVQSGMNAKVITGVDIRIPPDTKVKAFFNIVKPFRDMIVANLKESRTLARLRDALLPKLMRGEVRVRLLGRRNASP